MDCWNRQFTGNQTFSHEIWIFPVHVTLQPDQPDQPYIYIYNNHLFSHLKPLFFSRTPSSHDGISGAPWQRGRRSAQQWLRGRHLEPCWVGGPPGVPVKPWENHGKMVVEWNLMVCLEDGSLYVSFSLDKSTVSIAIFP